MPILLFHLLAACLALGLSWSTPATVPLDESRRLVTRWAACVLVPVSAYFAIYHRDWAYLYLVDPARVPALVDAALVLSAAALVPLTFGFTQPRLGARAHAATLGGAIMMLGTLVVALRHRLFTSGTLQQFRGKYAVQPLVESSLGRGMFLAILTLLASLLWTHATLRKMSYA